MYYLGCSGWFYWHWKKIFYPENLPQSKWFQYYAKKFNTVELNSTFYHLPKITTVRSWYKNSPKDFVFTLKVNKNITHIKKFENTSKLIKEFYSLSKELKEKTGCFLFQLPPSIKFNENKLKKILEQFDPEKRNVLEFRDKSWFREETFDKLKENNTIFCIVSSPNLPEIFVKTSNDVYIRFHGKQSWYSSNYTEKELELWKDRIKKAKAKNVWVYFNNDANAYAVENCLYLKKILE